MNKHIIFLHYLIFLNVKNKKMKKIPYANMDYIIYIIDGIFI